MNILDCYGVGIVAMDKETDTDEIQVYLPINFPESDGEVVYTAERVETPINSPTGDGKSSTTLQSNAVSAKWFAINTNRVTAPDVRKGSKVVVYKFKGQNTYRWTYFGMDGTLRLETIVYAISASPNVDQNSPVTPDNYYMFLISTHTKKIQLLTGQGNGEPTNYSITLDTGNGQFSIVDGESNILSLNSMAHALSFINDEKSFMNIEKKNISFSCDDTIILQGKEDIKMQCTRLAIKADESISIETLKTSLISPEIYIKGNITQEGNYNQTGNYAIEGNTTKVGNFNMKGNFSLDGGFNQTGGEGTSTGDWTIKGIKYSTHWHQGYHGPTGGPQGR